MGSLVTFNALSAGNRAAPTTIGELSFSLPFPKEVSIKTAYGWESTEIGTIGEVARNTSKNFGADGTIGGAVNSFGSAVFAQGESIALQSAQAALNGIGKTDTASTLQSALSGQGLLINPKLEVLFKSVTHRQFELTFDLAPTTATDSVNVILFLRELHVFAAPSLPSPGAPFFEYPKTTTVVIKGDGSSGGGVTLNRGNCAITSIDCNMTPDGLWSSFKNGKPTHVLVTIGFLELDLPTKENEADLFG